MPTKKSTPKNRPHTITVPTVTVFNYGGIQHKCKTLKQAFKYMRLSEEFQRRITEHSKKWGNNTIIYSIGKTEDGIDRLIAFVPYESGYAVVWMFGLDFETREACLAEANEFLAKYPDAEVAIVETETPYSVRTH